MPRVGVLATMIELYREIPDLRPRMEAWAAEGEVPDFKPIEGVLSPHSKF